MPSIPRPRPASASRQSIPLSSLGPAFSHPSPPTASPSPSALPSSPQQAVDFRSWLSQERPHLPTTLRRIPSSFFCPPFFCHTLPSPSATRQMIQSPLKLRNHLNS